MSKQSKTSRVNLRNVQANILSTGLLYNLGVGRRDLPPSEFLSLLTWTMTATKKGKSIGQKLRQILFPRTIKDLKSTPLLPIVSIEREIYWFVAVVIANAKRVNYYLDLANEYEIKLLASNSEACEEILKKIEAEFGLSVWLIETKIAHLQHFEGVEAQKKYLNEVKLEGRGNIPWLATNFSLKNEGPTTFFRYFSQTTEVLDEVSNSELRASLKFQSLGIVPDNSEGLCGVFFHETNSSLIDVYNALVEIIQKFVVDSASETHVPAVKGLMILAEKVTDVRLQRLMFLAGKVLSPSQIKFEGSTLYSKSSKHEISAHECSIVLNNWPVAWKALAERLVDSKRLPSEEEGIQSRSIRALYEIYSKGFLAERSLAEALKATFSFRWTSFSRILHSILLEELSTQPIIDKDDALVRFVFTPYLDPYFAPFLPDCCKKLYLEEISKSFKSPVGELTDLWAPSALYGDLPLQPTLAHDQATMKNASYLFSSGEFLESINVGKKLLNSSSVRKRRLAARLISAAMSQLGQIDQLVELVAATVVSDPGSTDLMPVAECAQVLSGKEIRKKLASQIAVPIVLLLNSLNYSDEFDKPLAYSYEDFLICHKINRPSQLKEKIFEFEIASLVFYLRYVCIPSVMKISSVFKGSVELQDERLAVCTLLLELDELNAKTYESEIREITRAQIIRSGVRHVEQSKMSIDAPAIRKLSDKKLKESFFRYRAMVAAGINPSADFAEAYLQLLSDGKPLPKEFLQVPTDEAGTLLRELVRAIFLESTSNPMHGLDCYLSMRIRHGALSGQLRGPLELEKIITQRSSDSNSYTSNEVWLNQLTGISENARDDIDLGLCIFSARYDSLIERLTNDLVQIQSKEKPNGLFYLDITPLDLRFLASSVRPSTTFDEFFDKCINLFWTSVEYCLQMVHSAIENRVKPEINDIFDTLQSTIRLASSSQFTADLDRAVRTAQTNSLQACEQMKDWFKLPTPRAEPLFEVEQLIDIGLQCVQRIHKEFTPIIDRNIPDLPKVAGALTIFSDIFFILFDNARKYANIGASPKLWIKVERDSPETLSFLVLSEVSPVTDFESCTERVDAIRSLIDSGGYHDSLRTEGGTGLIKLKKIIGPYHLLEFGHMPENKFFVKFNLTLREISI